MIKINPYSFNTNLRTRKSAPSKTVITPSVNFTSAQKLYPNGNYPKKLIKLLVLDIDGTISNRSTNTVHNDVKEAVSDLIKRGIKVVLNTGRDYEDATKIAKELNLDTPIICNYGQYIMQDGKILYESPIDKVDLKGDTMEYFANQLGIKKENIMSVGDDVEDVSIFKKSGTAVFVQDNNSPVCVHEIIPFANYIADKENYSAVALAIKKLIK